MPNRNQKPQSNGLLEPYTVMIDEKPTVVNARDHHEAYRKAKRKAAGQPDDEQQEDVTEQKNTDGE